MEQKAPVEEKTPPGEGTPAEENMPTEEKAPVEEKTPPEERTPAEENIPTEEKAPVEEKKPMEEDTPTGETTTLEEKTPMEEKTALEKDTPTEDKTPAEKKTAEEGKTPVEENTVVKRKLQQLDHESLTLSDAKIKNSNIIRRHTDIKPAIELLAKLGMQEDAISETVRAHLRLEKEAKCFVPLIQDWIWGKFNICVPVRVESSKFKGTVMMRFPKPYALAESYYPGSIEEKLRAEVGAYSWFQQKCPDIRIPHLYGFGIANRHFTHQAQLPWYARIRFRLFQWLRSLFRLPAASNYASISIPAQLSSQYMLIEYIPPETGRMLSSTWKSQKNDPSRRKNLFQGLARIMISMSRIPQPRIGSFQFNDDCTVSLTGRPASAAATLLENGGAERSIGSKQTYTCTEPYVSDVISLHDDHFYVDVNATDSEDDCRGLMSTRVLLRALSHRYIKKECRYGPFMLQLTDLHQSNIFVTENWEVACLIDLEWICALPPESQQVPYWLACQDISDIVDTKESQKLTEFNALRQEFMQALSEEESKVNLPWPLTKIMEETWQSGATWFWHSLASVNAAYYLFQDHICPRFSTDLTPPITSVLANFWREGGGEEVVAKKVADFERYQHDLDCLFAKMTQA